MVLPTLETLGQSALNEAVGLATDLVSDAYSKRRPLKESLKRHGLRRLKNVGKTGIQAMLKHLNPASLNISGNHKRKATKRRTPAKTRVTAKRRRALF